MASLLTRIAKPTIMPTALAAMLLALSACFTGIESTPGISKAELRRQRSEKPSAEQLLISTVRHEPFAAWPHGKRFVITDPKIAIAMTPATGLTVGSELRFSELRPVVTIMADSVAELIFISPDGNTVTYRTELPPSTIRTATKVDVPFTVEQSMIATADSLLRGRRLYILTPHRLDADGTSPVEAPKFVPVTVTEVSAGTASSPLRIIFTDADSTRYSILINADSNISTSREFHRLFSLSDPRRKYPKISDGMWTLITHSSVAPEMTREEVRLALGSPDEVERMTGLSNTAELWTYPDGRTLLFEEGILTRIR